MVRIGHASRICVVALAIVEASCGKSSGPLPGPSPGGTCRTYPIAATVATTSSGATISAQMTGKFDSPTNTSTVVSLLSSGAPCSTTVTSYNSVADFVDEVRVIPGVTLAIGNLTTNSGPCGPSIASVAFSYDTQRRLVQSTGVEGTTTYTAWDGSGRPTAGGTSTGISISNVYDNTARTVTQTAAANGTEKVSTTTYDGNGNQTQVVIREAGTTTSTTTFTNGLTAMVCK